MPSNSMSLTSSPPIVLEERESATQLECGTTRTSIQFEMSILGCLRFLAKFLQYLYS